MFVKYAHYLMMWTCLFSNIDAEAVKAVKENRTTFILQFHRFAQGFDDQAIFGHPARGYEGAVGCGFWAIGGLCRVVGCEWWAYVLWNSTVGLYCHQWAAKLYFAMR